MDAEKTENYVHSKDNRRAEFIRSKRIQDFNLLDHLHGLVINDPKYNTSDIKDPKILNQLMVEDPLQLVRFDFSPVRMANPLVNQRQRNRLKNRYMNYPPLSMCAHWIVQNLADKTHPQFKPLKSALLVIDWSILSVLLSEVVLQWLDDFHKFWRKSWNIFDLFVLILSIIPDIIGRAKVSIGFNISFFKVFRILRIFRHLKNIKRFHQVRLILLAISKAFKAMTFILGMMLIFAFVFAIGGVTLFMSYTKSDDSSLEYREAFGGILNALKTLFQLFTLDHWYPLLLDVWRVKEVDKFSTGIYIIVWILLGSFIFRNIMVGIMVSNFQTIRAELSVQIQQIETLQKADYFKMQLMQRRLSQEIFMKDESTNPIKLVQTDSVVSGDEGGAKTSSTHLSEGIFEKLNTNWDTFVRKNIQLLKSQHEVKKVTWPRDSLFRYYELLEQLQYNLDERKKLQDLAAQCLLNMHDV